jgi:hypothetical protein
VEIAPIPARSRVRLGHLVEEQRIDVIASPDLAGPALLDRIGELNRSRLLPVIERVLDEHDRPGELVRIGRLTLDLGRFGADLAGIETRLADALRAALGEALGAAGDGYARLALGKALVDVFEHYLLHGVWPYGSSVDPATTPASCLAQLIAEEPAALAAMLRRLGPADRMLRRLVGQMPEAVLQALLHRLEPAHAAIIVSYLDDVRASHEVAPVVPATPAELDEMLWTIVLRDALAPAGLEANRKAFLRRLLTQLAASGGVAASALTLALRRGLRRARIGRQPPGSLVGVLAELVTEDVGLLAEPLLIEELAGLLGPGPAPPAARAGELRQLLALGRGRHRPGLAWLLRRLAIEDAPGLAARLEGALPLADALALLGGEAPQLAGAGSRAERAALLRRAALAAGDRVALPPATGALAAVAQLLDGDDQDGQALLRALERARAEDPLGLRRLLRELAIADAGRLRRRMAAAVPAAALPGWLLPPHLAAALAGDAPRGPHEWEKLLEAAGRASESALPSSLRRRPQAGERGEAERLARNYAALDQAAALWSKQAPFSPAARARALGRLLPALGGLPAGVLLRRLRAAGGDGAGPDLAALAPAQLRRLGLLLAPTDAVRASLRAGGGAASIRALVERGETPEAPLPVIAPDVSAPGRAALAATLRRLSPAALDRLIAALAAGAPAGSAAKRRGLPRWQVALALALRAGKAPWREPAAVAGGDAEVALALLRARLGAEAMDSERVGRALDGMAQSELERLLELLAPATSAKGRAVRRRLRGAPGRAATLRMLVAALIAGAEIAGPAPPPPAAAGPPAEIALAALLRTRPLAAIRLIAGSAPETLAAALPDLLDEPDAPALLFAALQPAERARAMALGRLLTGRSGRAAIAPSKVARALTLAAGAREWRGGAAGFTAHWLDALLALASVGERRALTRLLGPRMLAAPAAAGAKPALRDPAKRAALVDALGEGELVKVLARVAPGGAPALLRAAERIAAARHEAGAGLDRPALWRTLLASAARDAGDVAPLAAALLDGSADAPAPPAGKRARTEQLLRVSLDDPRDAPLRAALDVRAKERRPEPVPAAAARREPAADPGAIFVANAGLVLVSAYLPRLFQALDFLAPGVTGRLEWRAPELRDRAVHLLQWLVDARCDAPEPALALNKLLAGMDPSEPVAAAIEPTAAELAACATLLATILANWPPLQSSSIEALRETFLQREGKLARGGEGWALDVERKVLDILIDQLPWGFSTILHPWMSELVTVRWG